YSNHQTLHLVSHYILSVITSCQHPTISNYILLCPTTSHYILLVEPSDITSCQSLHLVIHYILFVIISCNSLHLVSSTISHYILLVSNHQSLHLVSIQPSVITSCN
ncbi:hypothetical protein LOTGIDRAFT_227534, partial [Lottia gigantea]